MRIAPRINDRLRREIESQAPKHIPIAEITRRVGKVAQRHGFVPPSYEQVRVLVHEARRLRRTSTAEVLVEVALRSAPPDAFLEHVTGTRSRRR